MDIKSLEKLLLENKTYSNHKNKYDLAFEISEMLIEARIKKGINQEKLATLLGTQQPSIARAENGKSLPSLRFLEKIALALGTYLVAPKFAFLEENEDVRSVSIKEELHLNGAILFSDIIPNLNANEGLSKITIDNFKYKTI